LFHLHFCIGLTFDGFTRFSRYRLSQKHPVLDKIISISFIIFCFVGFSPIALLMESYSFLVSPDEPEVQKRPIYNRPFIKPLLQAVILLTAVIVAVFRSNA
jgi:multisubunit Na+/H+ antiporter MnhC subunit